MLRGTKRLLSLGLVAVMGISMLTGCGSDKKEKGNEPTNAPTSTEAPATTEEGTTPTPGGDEEPTPTEAPENGFDKYAMNTELTAIDATALMGNGINLGNTMEAYGHQNGKVRLPEQTEKLWGQPTTTKEIIEGMKAVGFDTLRIPVAWTNAMAYETGDYTIGKEYLDRIEEITNWALDAEMYVIINDHWDGSWWGMFGSATAETREKAMDMYVSMWTQICERFGKYGDHVIFEGANEELGDRLNDTDVAKDSGTLSQNDCYRVTAEICQKFVDIVRATGGNNANRFLLIPGYNTDIGMTCDNRYTMPTDTVQNRLMISVHYYTPWGYCGNSSLTAWGTTKDYDEQNGLLAKMKKFTDQGYGVVIGEYAVAFREDGTVKDNLVDFLDNFLNNCDCYGYCPVLWDCNGLYKRLTQSIMDDGAAELYLSRTAATEVGKTAEQISKEAKEKMDATYESITANSGGVDDNTALAWIMFNSSDYSYMYSVGDTYDPSQISGGVKATDALIDGEGLYTIGLDFTGTGSGYAVGTAFSAIGIANGETLYPGYYIDITSIKVNGEEYKMIARPYTTSDDKKCTRVNLYNEWVKTPNGRTSVGGLTGCSATVLDNATLGVIKTLEITFRYHK